jgi:hypothetical protein
MIWNLPPLPATSLERFLALICHLIKYIGPLHCPGRDRTYLGAVFLRVDSIRKRFARLVERFRDGTLGPPRRRADSGSAAASSEGASPHPRPDIVLPRSFAWLCGLMPQHAAHYGGQLRTLMDDPELIKLLAIAPQAGRVLRPLFRMLGHAREMPEILRLPPRTRRAAMREDEAASAPDRAEADMAPSSGGGGSAPAEAPRGAVQDAKGVGQSLRTGSVFKTA